MGAAYWSCNVADHTQWWWWYVSLELSLELVAVVGIAFANANGGGWGRKPKTEHRVSVSGRSCANAAEMGCCMDTATHCAVRGWGLG